MPVVWTRAVRWENCPQVNGRSAVVVHDLLFADVGRHALFAAEDSRQVPGSTYSEVPIDRGPLAHRERRAAVRGGLRRSNAAALSIFSCPPGFRGIVKPRAYRKLLGCGPTEAAAGPSILVFYESNTRRCMRYGTSRFSRCTATKWKKLPFTIR